MVKLNIGGKLLEGIKKYRYALLILFLGLVLLLIPGTKKETPLEEPKAQETVATPNLAEQLEQILSKIEGAGQVSVMLSVKNGEQILFQEDKDSGGDSIRQDTVIVTGADREQSGLVQQVNPPTYLGAIVVCKGADRAQVRLAIVEAVSRVTGLGADQISVLKMK